MLTVLRPTDLGRSRCLRLLDGCADDAAPLAPGALTVADIVVAQQWGQREPGTGGTLSDTAVGYGLLAAVDTLASVQLL